MKLPNKYSPPFTNGRERGKNESWSNDRRYHLWRWAKASKRFLMSHPICARCGMLAQVTDHIVPPWSENAPDFFDESNWQPLCSSCNSAKANEDKSKYRRAGDVHTQGEGGQNL